MRLKEAECRHSRHSEFGMGLYGYAWCYEMALWPQWAKALMVLNPHKRQFLRRDLDALGIIQSAL